MKLRYIFAAICSFALLAVGCNKEEMTSLSNIEVSKTYVSIPSDGGSVDIEINAKEAWEFDAKLFQFIENRKDADGKDVTDASGNKIKDTTYAATPKWLTVTPLSGDAGKTTVTFSAEAYDGGREEELRITCGQNTQILMVRQGNKSVTTATCQEVIDGPDAKTYRVTGTCKAIANTTYGNWYLNDGTSEKDVYVYGTLDAKGAEKNFSSLGIEIGDKVTVEGPKTTYNGTVELVNVTVIKIVKSLAKIVTPDAKVAKEGEVIEVKLAHKAAGALVTIPEDVDWVSYLSATYKSGTPTKLETNPADTTIFKFRVAANEGKPRSASISFSAGEGKNASVLSYTIAQDGAVANSISEILEKGPATYTIEKALVMAKAGSNVIVSDGTGNMMVYSSENTLAVGDYISLVGQPVTERNGLYQFNAPTYTVLEEKGTPDYGKAVELATDAAIEAYEGKPQYNYVHMKGTMGTDNRTIKIGDWGLYIVKTEGFAGKVVDVYGYANGKASSYKTITTTLVSIAEDSSAPSFSVSKTTLNVGAADTEAKFNVSANVEWSITCPAGVTASPEDGDEDAEVVLSFAANTAETAKEYKVTVSTEADVATKSYDVTIKQDGLSVKYNTIAECLAAAKDTEVKVNDALVVLVYAKGFLMQDATGTCLVYVNAAPTCKVGDKVKVLGKMGAYNGAPQVASPEVTVLSSGNTVDLGTPAEPTVAEVAALESKFEVKYIKVAAKVSSSKKYEATVKDGTTLLSINYDNSVTQPNVNESVVLTGITYGYYSSAKKVYLYATKCEADASAKTVSTITVSSAKSVEVGKTVELGATVNSGATLTYASSDEKIATVSSTGVVTGVAAGTATITVTAPETDTYAAATAKCTVTVSTADGPKTVTVVMTEYGESAKWTTSAGESVYPYDTVVADNVISITVDTEDNSGSLWSDGWRFYQTGGPLINIAAAEGYELKSAAVTFTIKNSATLKCGDDTLTSGKAYDLSGSKATLTIGNSGDKTNGQVKITKFVIQYQKK